MLLKMFAVLRRRNTVHPLERSGKMKTVVDADRITNFVDRTVSELKQPRRLRIADMQKILIRSTARLGLEIPQKYIFRKSCDPGKSCKIDLFINI